MNNLLNIEERNELERCEVVIKQGLKTFVEVGQALMLIRDKSCIVQSLARLKRIVMTNGKLNVLM
jgi:hypothetical protein